MDPYTALILGAAKAGFEFGTELLRYLQTAEGQAWVKKLTDDAAEREKLLADAGGWLTKLLKGDLLK